MDDADELDVSRWSSVWFVFFVVRLNPPLVNALVSELIKLKSSEDEEEEVDPTAGHDDDVSLKFTAEELLQLKFQMQMVTTRHNLDPLFDNINSIICTNHCFELLYVCAFVCCTWIVCIKCEINWTSLMLFYKIS